MPLTRQGAFRCPGHVSSAAHGFALLRDLVGQCAGWAVTTYFDIGTLWTSRIPGVS